MTATSERSIHSSGGRSGHLSQRSAFGTTRGIPWWGAFLLPLVVATVCAVIDTLVWSGPGVLFTSGYLVSTLLAVMLVRRGSLFGPMVQPPLIVAIVIPCLVLAMGIGFNAGDNQRQIMLSLATPLINSFPAMAAATALVLAGGLLRAFVLQPLKLRGEAPAPRAERSERETGRGSVRASGSSSRRGSPGATDSTADDRPDRTRQRRTGGRSESSSEPPARRGAPAERGSGPRTRSEPPRERPGSAEERGRGGRPRSSPDARDEQSPGRGSVGESPAERPSSGQGRRPGPPGRGNAKRSPRQGESPDGPGQRRGRTEPPGRPRRPRRDEG
ncbi:hypothetical protein CDG81_18160 [Actinopolyspora erythraea]|uniref:DUF6542 domain-containing protein n=1 Tax=Actinopolyspora erythraea TaxID=414996 RepID=A0A099D1D6_9ACTN|nr:DUF6542 domain-containing protein [Actinopolyspora erythraea]ASU79869.1 hypothetical protein CDG81_18160 [Actinopolyspora erythraea]KGI79617.1 hypothetical protein IL38_21890 [Actinopolyspora erythraea]